MQPYDTEMLEMNNRY